MEEPSKKRRRQTTSAIDPQRAKQQRLDGDASTDADGHNTLRQLHDLCEKYAKQAKLSEPGPEQDKFQQMKACAEFAKFVILSVNFLGKQEQHNVAAANRALDCVRTENLYMDKMAMLEKIPVYLEDAAKIYGVKKRDIDLKFTVHLANDIPDTITVDDQHLDLYVVRVSVMTIEALLWKKGLKVQHGLSWRWVVKLEGTMHPDLIERINQRQAEIKQIVKAMTDQCGSSDSQRDLLYHLEVATLVDLLELRDEYKGGSCNCMTEMDRPITTIILSFAEQLVPDMTKEEAEKCLKFMDDMVCETKTDIERIVGVVFGLYKALADVQRKRQETKEGEEKN